eukprot:12925043-Prorocentrum_lima.AAC.1
MNHVLFALIDKEKSRRFSAEKIEEVAKYCVHLARQQCMTHAGRLPDAPDNALTFSALAGL